jgi:LacI family transcriptional regulator
MGAEAVRKDIGLLMMTSGEDPEIERRAVGLLTARGIDGLAIIPTSGFAKMSRPDLRRRELPVVLIDRIDVEGFDGIGGENVDAADTLVDHLLSLGHKRVGLIRGLAGLMTTAERELGYRRAHERHGVPVDKSLVVDGHSSTPRGRDATERLLRLAEPPTAIFCTNNNMTVGSMAALQRLQVTVPDEMALVAFDDTEWSGLVEPGITCMAQPFHAMGIQALKTLLARIDDPTMAHQSMRMRPSYEHRGSCGCRVQPTS